MIVEDDKVGGLHERFVAERVEVVGDPHVEVELHELSRVDLRDLAWLVQRKASLDDERLPHPARFPRTAIASISNFRSGAARAATMTVDRAGCGFSKYSA